MVFLKPHTSMLHVQIEIIYEPKFGTYISGSHVWYCNVGQKFSYVAKNWIEGNYTENTKYLPKTGSINRF